MSLVPCLHTRERALACALRQRIYEPGLAPGCVPMSPCQRHGQRQAITYKLDVSFLLELSGDEGTHLGVLFPCVQRGTCREA